MIEETPASPGLKQAVRRYWNAHPISIDSVPYARGSREQFDEIFSHWKHGGSGTPKLEEFLASCRGKKVLEVGCGIGIDGRFLSEKEIDYQAVDLSLESLELAKEHFRQNDLRCRFVNADATQIPFGDGTFDLVYSFGVLHHVPGAPKACDEIARVLRPGGVLRVMLYHRHSYHYFLVSCLVRPLIWLLLRLPFGETLARLGPTKLRCMYQISKANGFSKQRLLSVSTDTSEAGENNFNPYSDFYTEQDLCALFSGFEDFNFWKSELKYFPLPWLRGMFERRLGFFLHMTARKRTAG